MVIGLAILAVLVVIFVVYPALVVSGNCSEAERQAEIMALQIKTERAASEDNDELSPLVDAMSKLLPAPGGGGQ